MMEEEVQSMDVQSLERISVLNAENEYMVMEDNEAMETQDQTQSANQPTQSIQVVSATQQGRARRAQQPQRARAKLVRKKRTISKCWEEFTSVGIEADGKERAQCHHCGIKLVIEKTCGTSTMNRHLLICPEKLESESRPRYDHRIDREMTAEIIIYHDLPFRYVEYDKVRARDRFLNPDCVPICRQTATVDVYKKYEEEKVKLKAVFAKYKGRVCFTSDLWSARSTMMGYICLTVHYVDDNWKLNNHILTFCDFKPPHTGEEIAKKVYDTLKEWGLEKKVFSITLENASANDNMQLILKHRLQSGSGLLCDGKFLHVRCCAHILNLIVKKGLKVANSLLENIRDSVRFVKASESRKDSFAACVESVGIKSGSGLSLDVKTRWNSTYEMLVRALKFRKAFANLQLYERNYYSLPSEKDWDRGEKIRDFLKPFSTITTYFSRVKYPTSNVYFMQVWKIELLLKKYVKCNDEHLRLMVVDMQKKFLKYWDEYSVVLAMGAVLDPRFKLQMLKVAYDKIDPSTSSKKVEIVRDNLILLYKEYTTKSLGSSSSKVSSKQTPHELLTESPLEDDETNDLLELERCLQSGSDNIESNLAMYLKDPRVDISFFTDMEVLNYWKDNEHHYGDLASLARDVLSVPITTVASESAFSVGGRVLNPFRNRLFPKNVQALICTRNWLRGFAEFEGDDDYFINEDEDATKKASSSIIGDSSI